MLTVIVTSAGTASAISVIKSLRLQNELELRIVAVDSDLLAAGLYLADHFEIVPKANAPEYIDVLCSIGKKYDASVLVPIYSKEISLVSSKAEYLATQGLRTLLSSAKTIDVCNNKREMNLMAEKLGIPTAKIYDRESLINSPVLPLFKKPNTGSSSSGTELIESQSRLNELLRSNDDIIFQAYVKAEEVTVDVFCNAHSEVIVAAPRLRLSTKSGQSVKGKTLSNELFIDYIQLVCKELEIKGSCNVQFFINEGKPIFIELNPRFAAGGLMLTVKSGANIPFLLIKTILGIPIQKGETLTRPDFIMTRYWEEIIFEQNNNIKNS